MRTKLHDPTTVYVGIGDVIASERVRHYVCHGLGSCVGIFLRDEASGMTGAAHIMLPGAYRDEALPPTCFAHNAIGHLFHRFFSRLQGNLHLIAKLVGGATLFGMESMRVGEKNLCDILSILERHEISVAGLDVGGSLSRTARFCSLSGDVIITSSSNIHYQQKI